MEVSGISAGLFSGASLDSRAVATVAAPAKSERTDDGGRTVESASCDCGPRRGRALGIFRQELEARLFARVGLSFAARNPVYEAVRGELSPQQVAGETVAAAERWLTQNPDVSRQALAAVRDDVTRAAGTAAAAVGADAELDLALSSVEEGLDGLEPLAARNVESSASVLSAETRLRERSTIRIRTQEGDVVKLELRRVENLSIEDEAYQDRSGFATSTGVDYSSRSRLRLSVDGDLNEAELAAISEVFAQAEAIAGEFFGGDLAAAFEAASALQYDTEQLARVRLRFRSSEVTNVSYARVSTSAPVEPAAEAPAPEPVTIARAIPAPVPEPTPAAAPVAAAAPARAAEVQQPEDTVATVGGPAVPAADGVFDRLDEFLDMLGDFLRSLAQGYDADGKETSVRYHYSEAFKLEILKSVISVSAPEASDDAAYNATEMIDRAIEVDQTSA
jgi:hypothetical protein